MDQLLIQLRACADPTRLRLLTLCARGAFCVSELTAILGQSQPRLSRHLKLLVAAELLDCSREGAHAWFSASASRLAEQLRAALPPDDPLIAADARASARVLAERARLASARFARQGADWDEMRALDLPAAQVEAALIDIVDQARGGGDWGDLLDLGTGTGRLLECCAPHAGNCIGIDASPAMLALARSRLARPELGHCRVRQADAYRLPFPSAAFDVVLAQMLLHHAEDPDAILGEARRVLRPGGVLVVIDLEAGSAAARHGFRWPGFSPADLAARIAAAGLAPRPGRALTGAIGVRLWPALAAPMAARAPSRAALEVTP